MPEKKSKKPRDLNRLAKAIVEQATSEGEPNQDSDGKDPAAVALGRKGGLKGGKARAKKLTKKRRQEIAQQAAIARWRNRQSSSG